MRHLKYRLARRAGVVLSAVAVSASWGYLAWDYPRALRERNQLRAMVQGLREQARRQREACEDILERLEACNQQREVTP